MAESKKFCKHSDGLGYCDILSDNETRQYCVEGPCPHEELVEYVPAVRCKDCKYFEMDEDGLDVLGVCKCGKIAVSYNGEIYPKETDFCSYGERKE